MKDIIVLQEEISLMKQEIKNLADKSSTMEASLREMDDLKLELKALKIFLGRAYPDFKTDLPQILAKLKE